MAERLHCPPRPCSTCPYALATPSGIWAPEEYAKLPAYDRRSGDIGPMAVFHCHQENATGRPTVCVGWLGCHGYDATAVRLALATGALTAEDVERAESSAVELHPTGDAAFRAGMTRIADPAPAARKAQEKLLRRKAAKT